MQLTFAVQSLSDGGPSNINMTGYFQMLRLRLNGNVLFCFQIVLCAYVNIVEMIMQIRQQETPKML